MRMIKAGGMKLDEFHIRHAAARAPTHGDAIAGGGIGIGGVEIDFAGAASRQHCVMRANGADLSCHAVQHISAIAAIALSGLHTRVDKFGAGNEIDGDMALKHGDIRMGARFFASGSIAPPARWRLQHG